MDPVTTRISTISNASRLPFVVAFSEFITRLMVPLPTFFTPFSRHRYGPKPPFHLLISSASRYFRHRPKRSSSSPTAPAPSMNIALDALHADLPLVCMSKLEIYTFGAASSHLNNPLLVLVELSRPDVALAMPSHHSSTLNGAHQQERGRSRSPLPQITRPDGSIASPLKATLKSLGHRVEDMERVITHVEHYAFAGDMMARCGVLDAVQGGTSRFAGRLFLLDGQTDTSSMRRQIRRDSGMLRMWSRIGLFSQSKGHETPTRVSATMPTCGTFDEYMDALFPLQFDLLIMPRLRPKYRHRHSRAMGIHRAKPCCTNSGIPIDVSRSRPQHMQLIQPFVVARRHVSSIQERET